MSDQPSVSVIIPCRNENRFIAFCLDSIEANDYPHESLEVLVVDGRSEDRTRRIVEVYAERYGNIRLIDNPRQITPAALNIGIGEARGDVIVRVDAHARLERSYIRRCVDALQKYGADNVGGIMKTIPQNRGFMASAIVASLCHRFGVGNSYFRVQSSRPRWVDTVFGGCYRRSVFGRVGLFNERLPHSQDMEFNRRLVAIGGRILLDPAIVSYYYARSDIKSFWKHNVRNGVWAILPFLYTDVMPVSLRHLVPLALVSSLAASLMLAPFVPGATQLAGAIAGTYLTASIVASCHVAWGKGDVRYVFLMPVVFGMLHSAYGLGSLQGVVRLIVARSGTRAVAMADDH